MGGCHSVNATLSSSFKPASVALGPTPSILPGRELVGFDDVQEKYTFEKEIGKGIVTVTHRVIDKDTGKAFACKTISKAKVTSMEDLKYIQREIKIFKYISVGHPNVCQFVHNYEDKKDVHIICEECTGGDLFDRILREKTVGEPAAAKAIHAIVSLVQHCHSMNVVHRDIKPESFMYAAPGPDAVLKAVDFRCARFWNPGEEGRPMDELVGSPCYVAPEMLRGAYGREVDIWSAGVLLYVLLSGYPPFDGTDDSEIFEQIVSCPLNLKSAPWGRVSPSAKELVRKMLTRDPKRRLTADQVLHHPWLKSQADATAMEPVVLLRMREFARYNKFKKEALKVLAGSMPEVHMEGLRNLFQSIDKDGSGFISVDEMRKSLKQKGANVGQSEVMHILSSLDLDGNQMVDYLEFIAATMRGIANGLSASEMQERLLQAFRHFDREQSGFITIEDMRAVLRAQGTELGPEAAQEILAEVDNNLDGKIDYAEFCAMILPSESQERPAGMLGAMRTSIRASRRAQPHLLPQESLRLREAPLVDSVLEEDLAERRTTEEEGRGSAREGSDWVAGIQVPSRRQYAKTALMTQTQQQHSDVFASSVLLLSGFTSCAPSSDGRPSVTATDGRPSLASLDGQLSHAGADAPLWSVAPNDVAAMIKEGPEPPPAGTMAGGEE